MVDAKTDRLIIGASVWLLPVNLPWLVIRWFSLNVMPALVWKHHPVILK